MNKNIFFLKINFFILNTNNTVQQNKKKELEKNNEKKEHILDLIQDEKEINQIFEETIKKNDEMNEKINSIKSIYELKNFLLNDLIQSFQLLENNENKLMEIKKIYENKIKYIIDNNLENNKYQKILTKISDYSKLYSAKILIENYHILIEKKNKTFIEEEEKIKSIEKFKKIKKNIIIGFFVIFTIILLILVFYKKNKNKRF